MLENLLDTARCQPKLEEPDHWASTESNAVTQTLATTSDLVAELERAELHSAEAEQLRDARAALEEPTEFAAAEADGSGSELRIIIASLGVLVETLTPRVDRLKRRMHRARRMQVVGEVVTLLSSSALLADFLESEGRMIAALLAFIGSVVALLTRRLESALPGDRLPPSEALNAYIVRQQQAIYLRKHCRIWLESISSGEATKPPDSLVRRAKDLFDYSLFDPEPQQDEG